MRTILLKPPFANALAIFALIVATPARASQTQTSCEEAFADSASRRTIAGLERVAAMPPVWDDYRPADHPVLLVADTSVRASRPGAVCAAVWSAGQPLRRLELPSAPRMSTPFYGMVDATLHEPARSGKGITLATLPAEVSGTLRSHGVRRAVMLQAPIRFERLGAIGEALARANADPAIIQSELAVHEGFHLHVQHPAWIGEPPAHAWPDWDQQPDRQQIRERCYAGADSVVVLLRAEVTALGSAFDALIDSTRAPDTSRALEYVSQFIAHRKLRYRLLDTVRVDQGEGHTTCAVAEDIMELEEGAVQWIGHASTVRAGLSSLAARRASYGRLQPDAFYVTAPLQLWILEGLLGPEQMRALGAAIARSSQPDGDDGGVFGRLRHQARAREAGKHPATTAQKESAVDRLLDPRLGDSVFTRLTPR